MKQNYVFILLVLSTILNAKNGVLFKENKNQWPSFVLFGANYNSTKFFMTKNGFNFCVYNENDLSKAHELKKHFHSNDKNVVLMEEKVIKGHNYSVNFLGATFLTSVKNNEQSNYYNYFLGNNKNKWASNVKAFDELIFNNIYHNIDLKLYSSYDNIKYDLILMPKANINDVVLNYKNVTSVKIINRNVVIQTSIGNIIEEKPYAYQIIKNKKIEVKCEYKQLNDTTIGYTILGGYDNKYKLIIDPTIVVCSYGNSTVWSNSCGSNGDIFGNIFSYGNADVGYPTTQGAFTENSDSLFDITVSKLNANGNLKLFSTYIGGGKTETPYDLIITATEIIICGTTISSDFPTTINAFDITFNDTINFSADAFVFKLDLTGSNLIASTFIGGKGIEGMSPLVPLQINASNNNLVFNTPIDMEIDGFGNVYVALSTNSTNFPITAGAFDLTKSGGTDLVAFKLSFDLTGLIYSTYLGGSLNESVSSIKLMNGNEMVICGTTNSANFPTTPGVVFNTKRGGTDIFISHFNAAGSSLKSSTYLGTSSDDNGLKIDIDKNNNIYLIGYTKSSTFTSTPGYYNSINGKTIIYKLTQNLSTITYKTKIGVTQPDNNSIYACTAFKVDSCQNLYFSGFTSGNYMPVTSNKFRDYAGGTDLWLGFFKNDMASLSFGSYYGGVGHEHTDGGQSYLTNNGTLYQGICINKGDLPTTSSAYQQNILTTDTTFYNDAFIKVDFQSFANAYSSTSLGSEIKGCVPFEAQFNSFPNTGTVTWYFDDGSALSSLQNTTHLYNSIGTYNTYLVVNDANTCNKTDTVNIIVSVVNQSSLLITGNTLICENGVTTLTANGDNAITFNWSTNEFTQTIHVETEGLYSVIVNNGGCTTQKFIEVKKITENINSNFPNVLTPNNDEVNDIINLSNYNFSEVEFTVYDRWGTQKFKTSKINDVFKADNCNDGTYFYTLNYKNTCNDNLIKIKGNLSVFRASP